MNLSLILPVFIFVIMFFAQILMSLVMFTIFSFMTGNPMALHFRIPPLAPLLSVSLIAGLLITALLNQIILKPMTTLASAINELGKGNFGAKIHLHGIRELNTLSDSFNRMSEELSNTEILRTDFINNFSHEFKTPLASLKGFARLLKDPNLTLEQRNEYLDIIIQETGRLSALSQNILELSKVEKMCIITEKQPFDLAEQIRRCVLVLEPKWSLKHLDLDIDLEEITYTGNPDLLNQVWINLIDNAVKFSPEGGILRILQTKEKNHVLFQIEDQGCGISPEALSHIFDKFYQGDTSHTTEGNGIGLAIVKRILTLCGGAIQVDSQEGKGTKITVTLPIEN